MYAQFELCATFPQTRFVVNKENPSLSDISLDQAVLDALPQSIDFWIVDLKYSPERGVTVIEFGHGFQSGFKVLDQTVEKGIVYSHFWKSLKELNLPMWYIGNEPGKNNSIAWDQYRDQGGFVFPSIKALEQDSLFSQASISGAKKNGVLMGCKGLVIMRYASANSLKVKNFMRRYPDFVIPSITTKCYVTNKHLTDNMFDTPYLQSFRPKCCIYERKYDKELAQRIINDLQCEWYVVKPINSGRGNGILFVEAKDLDKTLKLILDTYKNNLPINNSYSYKTNQEMTHEYWKHDRNSHFLVEEYVHSKPIMYQTKEYDATMRVAFTLMYDRGNIYIDFFNAYWKRPVKALSDEGTFREKHLSKHQPNFQESLGGFVSVTDCKAVQEGLKKVLPGVYLTMLIDYHSKDRGVENTL